MMNLTYQSNNSKHQKIVCLLPLAEWYLLLPPSRDLGNSNVTYVTHYRKDHLTKSSLVLKSTLQKQSNGQLLEGTTKSPHVINRHGIFLMIIMNFNVMLISSFNGQCQHKNSSCGNGYTFSCHSIQSVFSIVFSN